MKSISVIFAVALALAGIFSPQSAHAEMRICNQSYDVLNVAFGEPGDTGFVTQGWWRVAPNQCAVLKREPLRASNYYIFAADVFGNEVLSGTTPMCVAPRRFEISGQENCLLRGFLDARFMEVETGKRRDWTVFVSLRPV